MNFATTNDIIGGNSGSPVVNKNARGGGPDLRRQHPVARRRVRLRRAVNRAVAVHTAALIEALAKIYGANRIVDELNATQKVTMKAVK